MRWRNVLLVSLVLALLVLPALGAQPARKAPKTEVSYPVAVVSSPAFRDLPVDNKEVAVGTSPNRIIPNPQLNKTNAPEAPEAFGVDAALQYRHGNAPAPSPLISFDGINNIAGVAPPDTQGDIGPDHYVQWVNSHIAAWSINRSTWTPTLVMGPVAGNTIWTTLGGQCASDNWGDPIVLWDRFRNRWVISQFSLGPSANGPSKTAIAVSKTTDPTGAWWLYCFDYSPTTMNDYPKFGVWPDGYYYTCNQFLNFASWGGAGLCVFEADKMITGDPTARQLKIDLGAVSLNYGGVLPAHFEGTNNPPGGSGYFVEVDDSSWMSPPLAQDSISLWKAHVNWTAGTFTVGVGGLPDLTIPVTDFTPLCTSTRSCIPQPPGGENLDAIGDRGMYRCQYRNFGSYEAMVFNLTVNAGSGVAGIRWFELRKDSGHPDWYLYQEGTYGPTDGINRWMGSAGQDHMGDLCIGYSMSSSSLKPSIGYAGRLAGDPVGTLPQSEVVLHNGPGVQNTGYSRWGDYSTISVDPVDDCTFWYTTEYVEATGGWDWATRIGAFKFGSCSVGPTGTLSGTVTDSATTLPIAGATVSATNGTITVNATTGGTGTYSMTLPVTPPTYSVTASAFGYTPANVAGIAITTGGTTTQDFTLGGATSYLVSGTVTDVNTGWGLYANVTITASGWAGTTIQTNPTTGAYAISLVGGATYNFSVASIVPGYNTGAATVGPLGGPATQNFALDVNNCGAPGYTMSFSENFDGVTAPALPAGWAAVNASGGGALWVTSTTTPYSAPNDAFVDNPAAVSDKRLDTPAIAITSAAAQAIFRNSYDLESGYDGGVLEISIGGGAFTDILTAGGSFAGGGYNGTISGSFSNPLAGRSAWTGNSGGYILTTVNLPASANGQNVVLRFRMGSDTSVSKPGWRIDNLTTGQCAPPPGGLIVGFVKDAATTNAISGATVVNATTAFTGSSNAQGFYAVYAAAGANNLTASKPTYQDGTATPTGVAHATVQQDFNLVTSSAFTLSGTVTDATTGWPLYASLAFTAAGYPNVNTWTDPVTGDYSVVIFGGTVYNVAGTAWAAGYTPLATTVGPIAGNTTQNYTMAADLASCSAPGYTSANVFQNFDGVTPPALPANWAMVRTGGATTSTAWATRVGTRYPSGYPAYSTPNVVFFNSFSVNTGNSARLYYTVPVNLTLVAPTLSFYMFHDTGYTSSNDRVQVEVSVDGGTTWQPVGSPISRYLAASNAWSQHTVALTGFTGPNTSVLVGINAISAYGNDIHLDSILIGNPGCSAPAAGGLIVGNVYDANTNMALNGATVNDTTSSKTATTAATPDPNVDDGFYCLYGTDGANTMNATAPLYSADNQTPTVPHFGAVRQDFHLPVGRLSATPTSLEFTMPSNTTGQQTFDLSNIGGGSLNFTLTEVSGHPAAPQWDLYAAKDAKPEGWAKGNMLTAFKKKPAQSPRLSSSADARRIVLESGKSENSDFDVAPAPADAWPPSGPIQLYLDDNSYDNALGLTAGGSFVWFNRFTPNPADFPFVLDQISLIFFTAVPVGSDMEILVYSDPDGDPSNGATFLYSQNVTVQTSDAATWNNYTLTTPVPCNGPGDVLIAVVNRGATGVGMFPAAMDQSSSAGRSWVGLYTGAVPDPPTFPADSTFGTVDSIGFPGNWMVRASGNAADVPWLDENPKTGLLAPAATQTITVDYNSTGLAPAEYLATISCAQDTPYGPIPVPVTLNVWEPVAAGAPLAGVAPLTVVFTGTITNGVGAYTYDWDFGDGSPHSTAQNPTHTYYVGGTFTVTFTATDSFGHTASDNHLVVTVTAPGAPLVYNFYDDAGRSRLCVNRLTGFYVWEILTGPGAGNTYTGTANIVNGGTKIYSKTSDPNYLNCTYDPIKKRASGYYNVAAGPYYSRLTDLNTTNNPAGCY